MFEVRNHPVSYPEEVRRLHGWADEGVSGWYVVIDNCGGVDVPWSWGLGTSWYHPNSTLHGTFEQTLVPVDEAALRIMTNVQQRQRAYDAEAAKHLEGARVRRRETP